MAEGLLLIISGPSGVGKGTVCRHLLTVREALKLSVSTTTRPPRPGEQEGREYIFTTTSHFQDLIDEDAFLEWAIVHNHHYGTRYDMVRGPINRGEDLILEIDVQGAEQVRKKAPQAVSIFLAPPSMKILEQRIIGRGTEDAERINRRLAVARREMDSYRLYDYVVVNDEVKKATVAIGAIIDAEKCKVCRGARPPGWGGE
ncbi:MAG TPA: guanylate kinase [Candidatus Limnocylindrales bacterium]|nr:guanylate kinase [Candidatus Limnocylindrales bacterium]